MTTARQGDKLLQMMYDIGLVTGVVMKRELQRLKDCKPQYIMKTKAPELILEGVCLYAEKIKRQQCGDFNLTREESGMLKEASCTTSVDDQEDTLFGCMFDEM